MYRTTGTVTGLPNDDQSFNLNSEVLQMAHVYSDRLTEMRIDGGSKFSKFARLCCCCCCCCCCCLETQSFRTRLMNERPSWRLPQINDGRLRKLRRRIAETSIGAKCFCGRPPARGFSYSCNRATAVSASGVLVDVSHAAATVAYA